MVCEIIDNFLDDFTGFRGECDLLSYDGEKNPIDGIFYSGVSLSVPEKVKVEIEKKLSEFHARKITLKFSFLRQSSAGVDAPHQAHTDSSMGNYSFMLYMNRIEDCIGGTSLLRHGRYGFSSDPINKTQFDAWSADVNSADEWDVYSLCEMRPNRAFIFDSSLMHRAEPVGGFGTENKDSRLVLTAFYD